MVVDGADELARLAADEVLEAQLHLLGPAGVKGDSLIHVVHRVHLLRLHGRVLRCTLLHPPLALVALCVEVFDALLTQGLE